jgi:hypothetical protein
VAVAAKTREVKQHSSRGTVGELFFELAVCFQLHFFSRYKNISHEAEQVSGGNRCVSSSFSLIRFVQPLTFVAARCSKAKT